MTKLSTILKQLIAEERLNISELARQTGILQPVMHRMVTGETDNPKIATLLPIAKRFNITVEELMGTLPLMRDRNAVPQSVWKTLPWLSWEALVQWLRSPQELACEKFIETNAVVGKNAYALSVKDSTMMPRFPQGALLIVDADLQPENGDFAIIQVDEKQQPTFKQVFFDSGDTYLKPLNPDFKIVQLDAQKPYKFLGVVVESRLALKELH